MERIYEGTAGEIEIQVWSNKTIDLSIYKPGMGGMLSEMDVSNARQVIKQLEAAIAAVEASR